MELPLEFEKRMSDMLKDEYDAFYKAFTENENYIGIRFNSLKGLPDDLAEIRNGLEKVSWCRNGYYIDKNILDGNNPYHKMGLYYFQEPSAMSVCRVLGIEEGDYVLDLCSAPGGKATQAGEYLNRKGVLVANEIVPKRCDILAENIERMGIGNAIVTNESPKQLEKKFKSFFNKIIVDAPCSGEGMFRKEPKALTEWSLEHTKSCAVRQKLIIDSALKMLAPGGRLVYSTCTFSPEENEGVAEYILENPDMRLVPIENDIFYPGNAGFIGSNTDLSGTKRLFPHKLKGEGHFIALFEKKGEFVRDEKAVQTDPGKEFREFEKKYLNVRFNGNFVLFGENLYLMPVKIDLDSVKVKRAGLFMGKVKKGRFEPSLALALALKPDDVKYLFEADDIKKYLSGETLSSDISGWCVVTHNGFNVGWAKGSCGVLKNHYPKNLRIK